MTEQTPANNLKFTKVWAERLHRTYETLSRFIKNFVSLFVGGRVSEIHYLEAKERYYSLKSIIEYYEQIHGDKADNKDTMIAINKCKDTLSRAEDLLTRCQEDLNNLWRALTRIRLIIFDRLYGDTIMSHQLDFCREEAYRLSVENDPEVKDMLQKLAEATATGDQKEDVRLVKRITCALIERMNTIRTRRIYDQYVKIRTYKAAFWTLMLLALLLIFNADLLVIEPVTVTFPTYTPLEELKLKGGDAPGIVATLRILFVYHVDVLSFLLKNNVIAFVFLSGLIGGLFSVVMRVRDRARVPGEEAYFRYYVLTKPFVGALGAVIVYVLFQSHFIQMSLVDEFTGNVGPQVFGFAFLSGFSERIVFPDFR